MPRPPDDPAGGGAVRARDRARPGCGQGPVPVDRCQSVPRRAGAHDRSLPEADRRFAGQRTRTALPGLGLPVGARYRRGRGGYRRRARACPRRLGPDRRPRRGEGRQRRSGRRSGRLAPRARTRPRGPQHDLFQRLPARARGTAGRSRRRVALHRGVQHHPWLGTDRHLAQTGTRAAARPPRRTRRPQPVTPAGQRRRPVHSWSSRSSVWCRPRPASSTDANLSDADLTGADLSKVNLTNVNLSGADLTGADLSDVNLTDANLSGARLNVAFLSGARLRGADLSGAELHHAILSGADMHGSNLRDANLSDAVLTHAGLDGVIWSASTVWPAEIHSEMHARSIEVEPGVFQVHDQGERSPTEGLTPSI